MEMGLRWDLGKLMRVDAKNLKSTKRNIGKVTNGNRQQTIFTDKVPNAIADRTVDSWTGV
jgi:hypothetical protein